MSTTALNVKLIYYPTNAPDSNQAAISIDEASELNNLIMGQKGQPSIMTKFI